MMVAWWDHWMNILREFAQERVKRQGVRRDQVKDLRYYTEGTESGLRDLKQDMKEYLKGLKAYQSPVSKDPCTDMGNNSTPSAHEHCEECKGLLHCIGEQFKMITNLQNKNDSLKRKIDALSGTQKEFEMK